MSTKNESQAHLTGESLVLVTRLDRIIRTPGICGGSARVRDTRLPVWGIVKARRNGCTNEDILQMYPMLSPDDITAALEYAGNHSQEVDDEIAENEAA